MYNFIVNMFLLDRVTEADLQSYVDKGFITSAQAEHIKNLKAPINESTPEDTSGINLNITSIGW